MMFRCPACGERCISARHKLSSMRKRPCPACGGHIAFSATGIVLAQFVPLVVLVLLVWLVRLPPVGLFTLLGLLAFLAAAGLAASMLFFLYATPLYVAGSRAARLDMGIALAIITALVAWGIVNNLLAA